jgi:C-terminal processing protease CtpA/Prc
LRRPQARPSKYKALKLFGEVFDIVRGDYVDKPDDAKLVISSIKGMLSGLDPHSSYMDAQGFPRHGGGDQREIRRRRYGDHQGRRCIQGRLRD